MVNIEEIRPGMKVKLVADCDDVFMHKRDWLGKVVTVRDVFMAGRVNHSGDNIDEPHFNIQEDNGGFPWGLGWPWYGRHVESIVDEDDMEIDASFLDAILG